MVDKTIIANYGDENLGKTSSVKLVYDKLSKVAEEINLFHFPDDNNGDLCAVLTINTTKIGISSVGDPDGAHKEWLEELIKEYTCEIIVAACRYDDDTTRRIESYAKDYPIWWSCNARLCEAITQIGPKGIQNHFNEQWAEEIANLIESWCYAEKQRNE